MPARSDELGDVPSPHCYPLRCRLVFVNPRVSCVRAWRPEIIGIHFPLDRGKVEANSAGIFQPRAIFRVARNADRARCRFVRSERRRAQLIAAPRAFEFGVPLDEPPEDKDPPSLPFGTRPAHVFIANISLSWVSFRVKPN